MKNHKILIKIIIIFIIIITLFVFAQELFIFIHNKPYKGSYVYQGNRLYVEVDQFVKMTNLKMYKQGNYYVLSDKSIIPPESFSSLVYFNNKPLKYVLFQDGKVYVDLFELAYFTNSKVDINKETGIVDYYSKEKIEKITQEIYDQIYNNQKQIYQTDNKIQPGDKKIQAGEKEKIPKDAIKLVDESPIYEDKNNRGELRYTAKVKNTYDKVIENIKVKIKIVSPSNDVLYEQTFSFSSLKPGETKDISLYWINNTTVVVPQVKHEIDFKGKEKEEN